MNQADFLNIINKLKALATMQDNSLDISQVQDALKNSGLSESDLELVYNYLAENKISISGITMNLAEDNEDPELSSEDDKYLNMYLEELADLPEISKSQLMEAVLNVKNGREEFTATVINAHLPQVVEIAKQYTNHGMLLEDLIQEGNIGLVCAANELTKLEKLEDLSDFIMEMVKMAILGAIDMNNEENNLEETVVAKINLLTEAATLLEQDLGHAPSIQELADYTKMDREEVSSILNLSQSKQ